MIKSMTAFARAEITTDKLNGQVEIRSYNSRHLDIVLRIPQQCYSIENKIKALITNTVARGRLEMNLYVRDISDEAYDFVLNLPKAKAYHNALAHLKGIFNNDAEISLDLLVGAGDIIIPAGGNKNTENWWPDIEKSLRQALDDLDVMRKREGAAIAKDFKQRINYVEQCIAEIKQESSDLLILYQQRLKERISALTNGLVELDPGRIAQEAAFLADKSDISEEFVRATSHIEQFRLIMNSSQPAGRKLNFLLQELNREFNTMGSKIEKAMISHIIVDVKAELEKIREQVQNVE
jgi:uncharacterized protein (TIGR00255 family)